MINSKKVFLGIFSLAIFSSIGSANAQEVPFYQSPTIENEAILFRINEITPVLNADKNVYACDFSTTFYNNSENGISGASLDLTWEDNSLEDIISDEMKGNMESRDRRINSVTARSNPSTISLSLEVPAIKSLGQSLIKSRIQTDRCFLLLNDPSMKVKSCRINVPEESARARSSSSENICANLFKYVSPKDPEYYSDFKENSAEADARKMSIKEKNKADIEQEYNKAVSEFEKASLSLSGL